jgi:hypothetical protein
MTFLTTITEAEGRVVDAVRDLEQPIVEYVRKGVALADERLPTFTYPSSLPRPTEVVDSQYEFVTALLAAQHDIVKAVVEAASPLVGAPTMAPKATKATKAAA